jgi:RNA polymerase sigma-70 factor (ECF subfamily)
MHLICPACFGRKVGAYTRHVDDSQPTEHLAANVALRQPEAFAALVGRVRGALVTWIALRLGPRLRERVTEEDVLQETLLQAYRTIDAFQSGGAGSFRRWLLSVAEHRIKDLSKFHGAQKRDSAREVGKARNEGERTLLGQLALQATSPASAAHALEAKHQMAAAIEGLPQDLRDVVVARALEERRFREVAELLGRPLTTVQAQYARGLRLLRDALQS